MPLGEIELAGSRESLVELSRAIRRPDPTILLAQPLNQLSQGDHSRAFSRVDIEQNDQKVVMRVDEANDRLLISGAPPWLAVLAENIENFAQDAIPSSHLHLEYFPGHFYIGEESSAIVVAIA